MGEEDSFSKRERVSFLVKMANRLRPSGQRLQIDASPTTLMIEVDCDDYVLWRPTMYFASLNYRHSTLCLDQPIAKSDA